MRILGLDPGPEETAAVIWSGQAVETAQIACNDEISAALLWWDYDVIACEHIQNMGMVVGKSVFETAYNVGGFRQIAKSINKPFHRVYRSEVKMALCGNCRAKDGNIRQALIDRLGVQGTKKKPGPTYGISSHLWAALAVAITYETSSGNVKI